MIYNGHLGITNEICRALGHSRDHPRDDNVECDVQQDIDP